MGTGWIASGSGNQENNAAIFDHCNLASVVDSFKIPSCGYGYCKDGILCTCTREYASLCSRYQ